jgi:hypothetical protein
MVLTSVQASECQKRKKKYLGRKHGKRSIVSEWIQCEELQNLDDVGTVKKETTKDRAEERGVLADDSTSETLIENGSERSHFFSNDAEWCPN